MIGDALSLVGLLQRTTDGDGGIQFQLTGTDIYGREYTIADARETMKYLVSAMENQNEDLGIQLAELEGEINNIALE